MRGRGGSASLRGRSAPPRGRGRGRGDVYSRSMSQTDDGSGPPYSRVGPRDYGRREGWEDRGFGRGRRLGCGGVQLRHRVLSLQVAALLTTARAANLFAVPMSARIGGMTPTEQAVTETMAMTRGRNGGRLPHHEGTIGEVSRFCFRLFCSLKQRCQLLLTSCKVF